VRSDRMLSHENLSFVIGDFQALQQLLKEFRERQSAAGKSGAFSIHLTHKWKILGAIFFNFTGSLFTHCRLFYQA